MTLLSKRSVIKEDKSNIITLGAIAKEMKKKDPEIVNATIGMLYNEEGKLITFKSVDKALNELTPEEKYAYASTPGGKNYHDALEHWIFRENYDFFHDGCYTAVMATPGGSGAISNTLSNYLNDDDKVLVPNYMWGNYKQFAYENHQGYMTYNLFDDDGNFNLADIKAKMEILKKEQGRILIIVNDPCHNPTGYSMTDLEWQKLVDIINEISSDNTPVILLHDMAYIDYDYRGFDATRNNMKLYKSFNENVLVILAFSGSKTLALYGIRLGAQIAISKSLDNINDFARANKFSSRAKWSNTTNLGMNLAAKILTDEDLRAKFEMELEDARTMLVTRANTFLASCKEVGLKTLPFKCGFFITIPCNNPDEVYKRLVDKKIHIIPMGNVIRVTIAAISVEDCRRLPGIIKQCLE